MVVSIVLGFLAFRRRDIVHHRAWMMRGYAIGIGAGTQAVTQLPWILAVGPLGQLGKAAILMLLGWLINVAVAWWFIRRSRRPRPRSAAAQCDGLGQLVESAEGARL